MVNINLEFLKIFSWKDLIDIIAVSLFFYGVLYFLRITKGLQIFRGVVLLAGFWFFAELLHLRTLSWVFEKLWTVGLFSLVVIFQPEIRKALSRLGQRAGVSVIKPVGERVVDRVVRVCSFLSERQIGGLIVIERAQSVEGLVEGCVLMDSLVSVELLVTIFNPLSPLHDGAVVVRGDRVVYASCILPLSKSSELPKKYGTRHRAALGISEESDALCVVVSEETGEISLAMGGKLQRNLDPEMLRALLLKELRVENA
ncbi:MAG: diadenylate cyclase CdaA [Aquificaceae bacterium]|nr:diadenylate cyclase CdaA [Aquificaceae bacterium]MCX7989023.1 diadenylate cyclase CdaA [Aquificaceae bacterium]MDW8294394.1 diadenylate cyclase CdaA [Aquificaceae bacterium]